MPPTVLAATPSRTLATVIRLALSEQGTEVEAAADAAEALAAIRRDPALVIWDVALSNGDAYDACRRIQAEAASSPIPVLLLVPASDAFDPGRARAAGAADWLPKPFEPEALVRTVKGLLDPVSRWTRRPRRTGAGAPEEPPTRLPPPRRRVRSRSWSRGVGFWRWFMRFFLLPHTYWTARMLLAVLGTAAVASLGVDVPGVVTGREEKADSDGAPTYHVRYRYTVEDAAYEGSSSVPASGYQAAEVGRPVRVRALQALPQWEPLIELQGPASSVLQQRVLFVLFGGGIVGFFLWMVWILPWREQRLLRWGTAVAGEVVNKEIDTSGEDSTLRVRYAYAAPAADGRSAEVRNGVLTLDDGGGAAYNAVAPGDRVTVLYDPARPDRSTVYELCPYRVVGAA